MVFILLFACGLISGFILFRQNTIALINQEVARSVKLSVIIPARNEETNLPTILRSLQEQTLQPYEIIVVNDGSVDRTKEIATSFGVKVIDNPTLPSGWTGKTWAVWNGYLSSTGEIIAFLDADVKLAPHAIESLIVTREQKGGVISVVPYHSTRKIYERLAMLPNILGVFAFTSPFESRNKRKGLYGSCIITTRADYERVNGHKSIQSEVLDDLKLGEKYMSAGIEVNNYLGRELVSFRMYPEGVKSELQGFAKGAVLSTSTLNSRTTVFIALWIIGLILSETFLLFIGTPWFLPLLIGYVLYTAQIYYLIRYVGQFGIIQPSLHLFSTLFFLVVMLYSAYQVLFLKHVAWKGRSVDVRRRNGK